MINYLLAIFISLAISHLPVLEGNGTNNIIENVCEARKQCWYVYIEMKIMHNLLINYCTAEKGGLMNCSM
jgi:hypothetical protein